MADRPRPRRFPVLYQVNARTAVRRLGATATLDDLDDEALDGLLPPGVDWMYLLGVWRTGLAGRQVSRSNPDVRQSCEATLPDLVEDDICGSCFAVTGYVVNERLGGTESLARLRARLAARGVALMLDFVPNHTAPDHSWVQEHPEYYVEGTEDDLRNAPHNWTRLQAGDRERVLAYGRDPYFPGWPDTLQLDYSSADVRAAMTAELRHAAEQCDGLRCDMAMLLLPDVFERTWGRTMEPFWPAVLETVHREHDGFTFMAEVYWDREYDLQQQGFDATYDKRLFDRLSGQPDAVRGHLTADPDYQAHSARFLENHDEPRAAAVFGTGDRHRAAAVTTFLCPGLRFVQHGQRQGWRIHVPVHLCRAPVETDDQDLMRFYDALLQVLADAAVHDGDWRLLDCSEAWSGNPSHEAIVGFSWSAGPGGPLRYVVAANLADHWSQGYLALTHPGLAGRTLTLRDRLGTDEFARSGDDLLARGLYLDVAPWAHQVLEVS
jgi:hypothetical protein